MAVQLLVVDPSAPGGPALEAAVAALTAGRLVAFPTDTLYGLAADPRHARAVELLLRAKQRRAGLAVPLAAANLGQVKVAAGTLSPLTRRLAARFWPGPLALIVDASPTLDRRLLGSGETVAIRVPAHAVARALARAFGHPVTATSVNLTGRPASVTAEQAIDNLGSALAVVLDAGGTPGGSPSTIVDARGAVPVLVRRGVVSWDRVVQSLT